MIYSLNLLIITEITKYQQHHLSSDCLWAAAREPDSREVLIQVLTKNTSLWVQIAYFLWSLMPAL